MAGILRRAADGVGRDAAVRRRPVPVAGNGHNIILVQVVKGQGTRAAEVLRADADPRAYGHDVGMYVRRRLYRVCCQFFVVGNVGAELVSDLADSYGSPHRMALAGGNSHCHVDDSAAGICAQLVLCIAAQVAFPSRVCLALLQILFIYIVRCTGNVPVSDAHFAFGINLICAADIAVVHIVQIRVGQGTSAGKALFGRCNAHRYRRVDLGNGFLPGYFHVLDAGIGSALDTALNVVLNLAHRRSDARCDSPAAVRRVGKGKINAPGYLDVAVIGPVGNVRTGTVGIGGSIINHQGMYAAVALVQGQAEGHAGIGTRALAVVGDGKAQGGSRLRPVFDGCVFHGGSLANFTVADDCVHIPF